MPKVAPAQGAPPYVTRLLENAVEGGQVAGHLALNAGKRDLYDGRSIDIRDDSRLLLARVPVNPCRGGVAEPGIAAFCDQSPVFELPMAYPSHMNLRTLHLNRDGQITLDGKLGSEGMRFINFSHQAANLAPHLKQIDSLFQGICAQVTAHPMLRLGNLVDLENSDLFFELPEGPEIAFEAEGRLPASGLRALNTQISLGKAPANSRYCVELGLVHDCEVLSDDGSPSRKVRIELTALVGAPAYLSTKAQAERRAAPPSPSPGAAVVASRQAFVAPAADAAPPSAAAPSGASEEELASTRVSPYCAALYAGFMDQLPTAGRLSLAAQHWAELSDFSPQLAEVVGNCQIRCYQGTRIDFTRTGGILDIALDSPLQVTLPQQHIPAPSGWLRRLLASVLVFSIEQVTAEVPAAGTVESIPTLVRGTLGLRLGRWTLGAVPLSRKLSLKVPRDPHLFAQLDRTAAQIARVYTFSPLVNLTHLVDLSRSQLRVTTARSAHTELTPELTLSAYSTDIYMGQVAPGSRIALRHHARLSGPSYERPLRLQASVTCIGWPELPAPVREEKQPPEVPAGVDLRLNDGGLQVNLQLGSRISSGLAHGIASGARHLAGKIPRPHWRRGLL